jgi:hypothetical protein
MTAFFSPEPQPTFSCSVKDGARDMSGFTYAVVELKNPASYLQCALVVMVCKEETKTPEIRRLRRSDD